MVKDAAQVVTQVVAQVVKRVVAEVKTTQPVEAGYM